MRSLFISMVAGALAIAGQSFAGSASSADYSFEYGSVNAGSASAQSGDYAVVSTVTADGVAGGSASSANYSFLPAVGDTPTVTPVVVSAWQVE